VSFCKIGEECTVVDEPDEAGDGLQSIVEFQVQIKGNNQREYEDKCQRWQNGTDQKLATKLTKDDNWQQLVVLLPARWWPDTLPAARI